MSGDNSLLKAALEYARRDWHVLPLNEGRKTPAGALVKNGHLAVKGEEQKG
jgi:hypothetical protein